MKRIYTLLLTLLVITLATASSCAQIGSKPEINIPKEPVDKPIIGVSASSNTSASAPLTYIKAIKRAGGVPLVIPMTTCEEQISAVLAVVDAIVMTGGEDVCPLYYGEEPLRAQGEIVPERDEFDYKLIRMAIDKDLPLLGICRGEQVLNVAFGGTLYQDIPSQKKDSFIKHSQKAPREYGTHSITIEKGSLLEQLLGTNKTNVNSFHHQAVKDVAPGFKATAFAADGVIEAIEMVGNNKVLGVQFHPEGPTSVGDDEFLGIFTHFIELAKKR